MKAPETILHRIYLPFTEVQLGSHFADVKQGSKCVGTSDKHAAYFKKSIHNYKEYLQQTSNRNGRPLSQLKRPCQIEKDEKFWTSSCLMTIFHDRDRTGQFIKLFQKAYGQEPPIDIGSWEECLEGELYLFFEPNLPSPQSYKDWLQLNLLKQQFIPYVLDSSEGKKNLEGPTNVDAILINKINGFAVVIEAKVLSDISYQITYDVTRNQIARNVNVILEKNPKLCPPLDKRDPKKTLFLLLTSGLFKNNPSSRLYGYKFNEYKADPSSLGCDLPHRKDCDWENISKRLGWLTWEDFREVNKNCCLWLK